MTRALSIVVDDDGQVWDVADPALHLRLGAVPDASFDLPGYLAQSAGWVAISVRASRLVVRLNPLIAAPNAVTTLRSIMAATPSIPVALVALGTVSMLGKGQEAQDKLTQKLTIVPERVGPRFTAQRFATTEVFRRQRRILLASLTRGRSISHQRRITTETAVEIARADQLGRTSAAKLVRTAGGGLACSHAWIGTALRWYSDSERKGLLGTDVRRSPDSAYMSWCAEAYGRAVASTEPMVEEVRALVHSRNGPPVDTRYLRLIQTYEAGDGEWLILTTADNLPLDEAA